MSKIVSYDKFYLSGKIDSFFSCISGKQGSDNIGFILYSEEDKMCSRIYYTESLALI